MPRIRQASLDVLMNKAVWRSPSRERRDAWKIVGTVGPDGVALQRAGSTAKHTVELRDPFGKYAWDTRFDLSKTISNTYPQFWFKPVADSANPDTLEISDNDGECK